MIRYLQLCLLICVWASGLSFAESEASAAIDRALTVYRDSEYDSFYELSDEGAEDAGLAMVTEYREIYLTKGENVVVISDIVDGIIPQTLNFSDLSEKLKESNFTFNLLTPSDLLFHSLNQPVLLERINPVTGESSREHAIIRSVSEKIMLEVDGKLQPLSCSGLKEKIIFTKIPDSLVASPELRLSIKSKVDQSLKIKLSYLVAGLQWKANYTAYLDFTKKTFDLASWVTLQNSRLTIFNDVQIQVVAGRLFTEFATQPPEMQTPEVNTQCWPVATVVERFYAEGDEVEEVVVTGIRASLAKQEELGDYKLYVFPHKTDLGSKQAKQIMLLNQERIPFSIEHEYLFAFEDLLNEYRRDYMRFARANLITKNTKKRNLGVPIPAGELVLFENKGIAPILLDEGYPIDVKDTPVDSSIEWRLGFDTRIRVLDSYSSYEGDDENPILNFEFVFANDRSENVSLKITQYDYEPYEVKKVLFASSKGGFENDRYFWTINLPAHSTVKFRAKVELVERYD